MATLVLTVRVASNSWIRKLKIASGHQDKANRCRPLKLWTLKRSESHNLRLATSNRILLCSLPFKAAKHPICQALQTCKHPLTLLMNNLHLNPYKCLKFTTKSNLWMIKCCNINNLSKWGNRRRRSQNLGKSGRNYNRQEVTIES